MEKFLTKEQVKQIVTGAPKGTNQKEIIDGLLKRGYTLEGLNVAPSAPEQKITTGSAGQSLVEGGLLNPKYGATQLADIIGGRKLAEGAGAAIKGKMVEKDSAQKLNIKIDRMKAIESELAAAKRDGREKDIKRLSDALRTEIQTSSGSAEQLEAMAREMPTTKEIIGSTVRLGATLASGAITRGASGITGANAVKTVGAGIGRGAASGAIAGATEGAIQGAGIGAEQNLDTGGILKSAAGGAVIGGTAGGVLGGIVGGVTGKMRANALRKEELKKILETKPNSKVAEYTLKGGEVVDDQVAQEAVKQGVDKGTITIAKGASPSTKVKMNKSLDILEKGMVDPNFKATNRPSDVLGESAMERFNIIQETNQQAASQLDDVAKSLKGLSADPSPAVQSFISDLDDMGIKIKNGTPQYVGSDLEGLSEPQKIINQIFKRMGEVSDDGLELHRLKKFIDEQVSYGKTSGGLTGRTEGILKGLRHNIDAILDSQFPAYNKVNTTFAQTQNAIDNLADLGGTKLDLTGKNAQKKLGTLMRRILSNTNSRIDVLNALQELQDVAEQYGGKFSDDIVSQTVFVNDLERLFGTSAPTSLAGEVSKGVQRAGTVATKLKSGEGIVKLGLEGAGNVIEKARGINEQGLIDSLRSLLK